MSDTNKNDGSSSSSEDSLKDSSRIDPLPKEVMEPEVYVRLTSDMTETGRKIRVFKRQLFWDRISVWLRELLEPNELKPVLLIVGTFLGLFFGFFTGFWAVGFLGGLILGILAAAGLVFFFVKMLYWSDLDELKTSCEEKPSQIQELEESLRELKIEFDKLYLEALQDRQSNKPAEGKTDSESGKPIMEMTHIESIHDADMHRESRFNKPGAWRTLSPAEFRSFIEEKFRNLGYKIQVPEKNLSLGVQLIAYQPAQRIAVKLVAEPIQVTTGAVQQAFSAINHLDCDTCVVITPGTFSLDARNLARSTKCLLVGQMEMERFIEGNVFPEISWSSAGS